MKYPKISIIMPVYNEADILGDALHHVSEINYPNLEILLAIDGNDGSIDIARKFARKNRSIRIDYSMKRRGAFRAQNVLLSKAHGDIIVKLDADSRFICPNEALFNLVKHYQNPKIGALMFNYQISDRNEAARSLTIKGELFIMRLISDYMQSIGAIKGYCDDFVVVSSFRRGIISKVELDCPEDALFAYSALDKGYEISFASDVKVCKIGNPPNPRSLMRQKSRNFNFWLNMRERRHVKLYLFYIVMLKFFLKNIRKYRKYIFLFVYWCCVYMVAMVNAQFRKSNNDIENWSKHRRI